MSRGFVKEDDLEHAGTDLPERPVSTHTNYVTPFGLAQLNEIAHSLDAQRALLITKKDDQESQQKLAKVDRDLRYISARLESAQCVNPENQPKENVLFGATVLVEDEEGQPYTFIIVGEDEADIAKGKVSYVSPIARALLGRKVGDTVQWRRPAGNLSLDIVEINY